MRPVVQIFVDDDEEVSMLWDENHDHIAARLGLLEWAKAVCIEALKVENQLKNYHEAEG